MKTRTLLLLALACGVAIIAAGATFLIQLSNQQDALAPVPIGQAATIGDMRIVVDEAAEHDGVLDVTITIGGVDDADGATGFHLIASGRAASPAEGDAEDRSAATTLTDRQCVIRFDVSSADGSSRVLFYERGDDRARWVLA